MKTFVIARNVAALVGAGYVLRLAISELYRLAGGFRAYFLAPWGISGVNLKKYGEWAVVTGASEGIGRGYALELARQGLNVVIMSRSREKLLEVASEIEQKYGRSVRVIPVDFTDGQGIYPLIAQELMDLDIGILVNNVALSYEFGPEYFLNVSELRLRDMIEVNCQAMVQMTHMLLPKMVEKNRGVIVNVSTGGTLAPCALLAVYTSSKIFVNYFSDALRKEYGSKGIVIQTTIPFMVTTKMSHARRESFITLHPEAYARAAVATIGLQNHTSGCWPHALQHYISTLFPRWIYRWAAERRMAYARRRLTIRRAQVTDSS